LYFCPCRRNSDDNGWRERSPPVDATPALRELFVQAMPGSAKPKSSVTVLNHLVRVFGWFSKAILTLASLAMCAVSVALVLSSLWTAGAAFSTMPAIQSELLKSVSLVVISVAIIDVAKYILEEEVLRNREHRIHLQSWSVGAAGTDLSFHALTRIRRDDCRARSVPEAEPGGRATAPGHAKGGAGRPRRRLTRSNHCVATLASCSASWS